mgnify:CR=1 FL=1
MAGPNPTGLCMCGCGERTQIPTRNTTAYGYVKGQPLLWRPGHNMRGRPTKGYPTISVNGTQKQIHRLRAEAVLGHSLPSKAVIHHPDHDSWNPHARLVICQNQGYHLLLHQRERVVRAGGNPNTDKICSRCHIVIPLVAFGSDRSAYDGRSPICKSCVRVRNTLRREALI